MCQIFAGQDPASYEPQTRRLRLNGQSTSIRLEHSFWLIIDSIAENEHMSTPAFLSKLHDEVLQIRGEAANFTSLLRCACMRHLERYARRDPMTATAWPATSEIKPPVVAGYYQKRQSRHKSHFPE